MTKRTLTVDEIIATVKHSNVPTLFSEGDDDLIVLRRMEDEFSDFGLSVFPVGGRAKVLQVFERRDELPANLISLFVADLDVWVYSSVPPQFRSPILHFTNGYSIENDLYRDGNLESLMLAGEKTIFFEELRKFLRWYALALARNSKDKTKKFALHPGQILDDTDFFFAETELAQDEDFPHALLNGIQADYQKLLRGKALFSLLLRQLSSSSRDPKHSKKALLEQAAAVRGEYFQEIVRWLSQRLRDPFDDQMGRQT